MVAQPVEPSRPDRLLLDGRKAALLESPFRQKLMDIVREQPGIPVGELMRRLDAGWGTLYHHLVKLSRAGFIHTQAAGRRRLVYPRTTGSDPGDAARRSILRGATARDVANAIIRNPQCSINDISDALHQSPRVVYYHVKRLIDVGLVESASRTRHKDLQPSRVLVDYLPRVDETEDDNGSDS